MATDVKCSNCGASLWGGFFASTTRCPRCGCNVLVGIQATAILWGFAWIAILPVVYIVGQACFSVFGHEPWVWSEVGGQTLGCLLGGFFVGLLLGAIYRTVFRAIEVLCRAFRGAARRLSP